MITKQILKCMALMFFRENSLFEHLKKEIQQHDSLKKEKKHKKEKKTPGNNHYAGLSCMEISTVLM